MRQNARVDNTHAEIRDVFRKEYRFSWLDLHTVGHGCPDGILGCPPGVNILVECKSPRGKLSDNQVIFHTNWQGPIVVLKSADEARQFAASLLERSGELLTPAPWESLH